MTLVVSSPPSTLPYNGQVQMVVTLTGASPIHMVSIDLVSDGQPPWLYVIWDARGTQIYTVGPFKKKGRSELVIHALDSMGCEISNGTRIYSTVQ
jgi:hypothetical protein